ncbi:hypothetical protein GWI33_008387 [Rhynchophorus ferrugineus]|uniref:Uncharacterized protein n=1 Tax=Rhynchophorus ferrugineus TaxID=354439 RepID=A0A834IIC7_RHYFE|nr:hypothetical protein GWI33_008387 [Rhynchophorus ferrugineus]
MPSDERRHVSRRLQHLFPDLFSTTVSVAMPRIRDGGVGWLLDGPGTRRGSCSIVVQTTRIQRHTAARSPSPPANIECPSLPENPSTFSARIRRIHYRGETAKIVIARCDLIRGDHRPRGAQPYGVPRDQRAVLKQTACPRNIIGGPAACPASFLQSPPPPLPSHYRRYVPLVRLRRERKNEVKVFLFLVYTINIVLIVSCLFSLPPDVLEHHQYTVLHWGAKYGNADIIKIFAGKYKVDVNGKTNGGYTPLHISAQFGHKEIFKLLIEVYKADTKVRDYSGKMAEYYLISKEQKETGGILLRKMKGRKKQTEKDLGFLRIGSLNVRVKKTTEAFSNFLGVGNSGTVNPSDSPGEKMHKGWGSADNVNKENIMGAPKGYIARKRSKRAIDSGLSSTPTTPKAPTKNYSSTSLPLTNFNNDSDSDSAAGFDSNWKN